MGPEPRRAAGWGIRAAFWAGAALTLLLAAPPCRAASGVDARARNVLAELKLRRILAPDRESWEPQERDFLERVRAAQARGALGYLRARLGTVAGLAVAAGVDRGDVLLTAEGYRRYMLIKAQAAREYFESKGAQARDVFLLTDEEGRPLFSADGFLTPAGEEVHALAAAKRPVFWKLPDGRRVGSVKGRAGKK